jgi:repressor LexA
MEPLSDRHQRLLDWIEDYIEEFQHPPAIRDMVKAMGLHSPSPIQGRLRDLQQWGYLDCIEGKAKTYRVLRPRRSVPILGIIAAHSLVEIFPPDDIQSIQLPKWLNLAKRSSHEIAQWFALRVRGDSMIDASIVDGDLVILKPLSDAVTLKNGTIVSARVGEQTTLKYFYRQGRKVILQPANSNYSPTLLDAAIVDIQGVYVGILRGVI